MKPAVALLAVLLPKLLHAMITMSTPAGAFVFSTTNGALVAAKPAGGAGSVWGSGENGLWAARFADGSELDASEFSAASPDKNFSFTHDGVSGTLQLDYTCAALRLRISATPHPKGLTLAAAATPGSNTLLRLDLPGRLRFAPGAVERFIMPQNGNYGLGMALNKEFFKRQSEEQASGWETLASGPRGYAELHGGALEMGELFAAPVPLKVTDEGRRWFPASLVERLGTASATVNRSPRRGQVETILVDSPSGPYFSASHLGGTGGLWRIGGAVHKRDAPMALELVAATVAKLAHDAAPSRKRIGLVSLRNGPERGSWSTVTVAEWRARLAALAPTHDGVFDELDTPRALMAALRAQDRICIVNPYGEGIPVASVEGLPETLAALREYVRAGGHWFEVGGHPFHQLLVPRAYLACQESYPALFADFMHLLSSAGAAGLYRVQPRTVTEPWDAVTDHSKIFIPGSLACGGDALGGYCERAFNTFVKPGDSWLTPEVRLTLGVPVMEDLANYAAANALTRPLAEKIEPEALARLKGSVLLYLGGSCAEKLAALPGLPVPTLIHFADYLKGGFDKEYPDHLPPKPTFGTTAEFGDFLRRARAMGHLVSPYTNPTWWCDEPRGPTFERAGTDPLLRDLDGQPRRERYAGNTGWTTTLWHPAVQAANRATVRQFTAELPVDILFQDQCGARSWHYDTNPASPTPCAYSEGMLAMNHEDSRIIPLGTESAWDHVANYQTMLCGQSWGIVPTEHSPDWVRLTKTSLPARTWEIFPLALALMHDKAIFTHHDLGQFVTDQRVLSWSLALGYGLSYRVAAKALAQDDKREWLAWLARLQKSLGARCAGQPLRAFKHDRAPLFATDGDPRRREDDGIISATYGDVSLRCNLGDVARRIDDLELPPYGFHAAAPGLETRMLSESSGYVAQLQGEELEVWLYARPGSRIELPVPFQGKVRVTLEGQPPSIVEVVAGQARLPTLPLPEWLQRTTPPAPLPPTNRHHLHFLKLSPSN